MVARDPAKATPIRQQYLQLKKRFPDTILFFQLGDFYETFDEDAEITHRVCEVVLTSRELGRGRRIPMAGVPVHAADHYIAKLLGQGYRVAVCNQMEDPATAKGIVQREVVRVVTPGTVVEPNLLEATANNYLAAVVVGREGEAGRAREKGRAAGQSSAGLAYADVTTGEFCTTQLSAADLAVELDRLKPAELLVVAGGEEETGGGGGPRRTPLPSPVFALDNARRALLDHFGVASLEGFGCEGLPLAVRAAGALIQYLEETQRAVLPQIAALTTYSTASYMPLDPQTRRHLELTETSRAGSSRGSLLAVLDLTRTPMGARLLRRWLSQPLLDLAALGARQAVVAALLGDGLARAELTARLDGVPDLERLINRIGGGLAGPRELVALARGLAAVPEVRGVVDRFDLTPSPPGPNPLAPFPEGKGESIPPLHRVERGQGGEVGRERGPEGKGGLPDRLQPQPAIVDLVARAIVDEPPAVLGDGTGGRESGPVIRPGFSPELDQLRTVAHDARGYLAGLERTERERTGIRSLKVGYNRVFGYYIEVTNPNLDQPVGAAVQRPLGVPGGDGETRCGCPSNREHLERCLGYSRKQTLVGAERFVTPTLKEYETTILTAQERLAEIEGAIFREVCREVGAAGPRILATAGALAELDVLAAFAEAAARYGYVRPELDDGDEIVITAGRHPVVERVLPPGVFVPNDARLSSAEVPPADEEGSARIVVLTGPNMAGKTVYGASICLIVLMAQIGSFVPAGAARIGLVDRIFVRAGAGDDISGGLSTFMVEMAETAQILHHATRRSLLFFDEVGRGTSTYDGMALAQAIVEHIHNHPRLRARTLFSTHYHELTQLEEVLPGVRNYRVAVQEEGDQVVFLHHVERGGADRSYGLHVARLAGVPAAVVHRAEAILKQLEADPAARGRRRLAKPAEQPPAGLQLSLFAEPHPVLRELASLDVVTMTPLEAITRLFELQRRLRDEFIT